MQTEISRYDIEKELRSRFALYKPYPKQMLFHNSLASCRLISGANQSGKVQKGDNLVLTVNGWRRMDSIVEGDILFDRFGKKTKVLKVFPHKDWDFYRVTFDDGSWLETGMEHLWMVKQTKGERFGNLDWAVRNLGDIVARSGMTPKASRRPKIPVVGRVETDAKELPIEPYLFGLLLGDGSFRTSKGSIRFSSCPEDMEYYKQYGEFKKLSGDNVDYLVKNVYICIRDLGLYMVDSHNKFIPDIYMIGSHEQRLALLQGLMDTDGSVCKKGHIEYCTVSKRLCEQVIELCQSIGCKAKAAYRVDKKGFYSYRIHIRQGNYPLFRLPRKLERCFKPTSTCDERLIYKVEYVGKADGACILVDSPDHTYIAQHYIVTHNTIAGTHETAFQATGIFPDWYKGWRGQGRIDVVSGKKVFNIVVAATDSKTLRDSIMKKIVGTEADDYSDGLIAKKYQVPNSAVKARSVGGGLLDSIQVYRQDGSICTIYFRSYEQGRENLQSLTADYVYCDEEPPQDVYAELMARLNATGGHFAMAFTPLKGLTPLVQEYWNHDNPDKFLTCMNIYEVAHIANDPDKIARIKSSFSGLSESEREARMMGIPAMGSGTVYPISDDSIKYDAFKIPKNWARIAAIDFGRGEHPIACVWIAFDPNDCAYVYDCFKLTRVGDAEIASQILARGSWIPMAYPHDFMRSSGISTIGDETKTEGWVYKEIFAKYGINFTDHNAKTEEGSVRVEAGIVQVRQAMVEGKFKVASHLSEWFKEKATYLYKEDGNVTKERDDLLDATRYAYIMRRYAISENDAMGYGSIYGISDKAIDNTVEND